MAFGQANGYPASHNQLEQLTDLLLAAGHTDFRDARGPLGLTQRQAAGKFTRDEADELIVLLQAEVDSTAAPEGNEPRPADRAAPRRRSSSGSALGRIPSDELAAELQRRGWVVMEP